MQILPHLDEPVLEFMVQVCQAANQVDSVSGNNSALSSFFKMFSRGPTVPVGRKPNRAQIRNPIPQVENNNTDISPNPQQVVAGIGTFMQFLGQLLNVIWENALYIKVILFMILLIWLLNNPLFMFIFNLPGYFFSLYKIVFSVFNFDFVKEITDWFPK